MHRLDRYESPLEDEVARRHVETWIEGGGTRFDIDNRIIGCDVIVATRDPDPRLVAATVIAGLGEIGTPRGSRVVVGDEMTDVGTWDGVMAVLPAVTEVDRTDGREIQRNDALDDLLKLLRKSLRGRGSLASFRIHEGLDAEVYVYGPVREQLRDALESVLASHPLGRNTVLRDVA